MSPILGELQLGGETIVIRAYGTFMVIAWIVALLVGTLVARRRDLVWWKALGTFAAALAIGVAGARLLDLLVNWGFYSQSSDRIAGLGFHGFSLYGGLIMAVATGLIVSKSLSLSPWKVADAAVPALGSGLVLMRVGCFLNGCCYGKVTDLPWGVTYPAGSSAWAQQVIEGRTGVLGLAGMTHPVHPTQLYEALAAVVLASLAFGFLGRRDSQGQGRFGTGIPFLAFALGFTLFRLANSFLRAPLPTTSVPTWFYPSLYLFLSAVILALLIWRLRSGERVRTQASQRPV